MNGFKTIIGMIVLGVISPTLVKHGLPALTPDEQIALTAAILSAAAIAFRMVTTTPVFSDIRLWIANRSKAAAPQTITSVSPEVLQAIAVATVQEFRKPVVQEKTV